MTKAHYQHLAIPITALSQTLASWRLSGACNIGRVPFPALLVLWKAWGRRARHRRGGRCPHAPLALPPLTASTGSGQDAFHSIEGAQRNVLDGMMKIGGVWRALHSLHAGCAAMCKARRRPSCSALFALSRSAPRATLRTSPWLLQLFQHAASIAGAALRRVGRRPQRRRPPLTLDTSQAHPRPLARPLNPTAGCGAANCPLLFAR